MPPSTAGRDACRYRNACLNDAVGVDKVYALNGLHLFLPHQHHETEKQHDGEEKVTNVREEEEMRPPGAAGKPKLRVPQYRSDQAGD